MGIQFDISDLNGFNIPNQHHLINMYGEKLAKKHLDNKITIELFSLNEKLILCELNNKYECYKITPASSTDVISLFERV